MMFGAIALLLAGYVLLMLSNSVRGCLRDGWRCVRRYPRMWRVLAGLGFANAFFDFCVRWSLHVRGSPQFTWVRAEWLSGLANPSWYSSTAIREAFRASLLPSMEALAGLFNSAIITFPIAVFAALGFLVNRRRTLSLLYGALAKRIGILVWPVFAVVFVCAFAVIAKAVLYFWHTAWLGDEGWLKWATMVMWPAALFECAFGLGVQAWLLLHAYAWVRGMSFDRDAMRDVAVRRLGAMAKWAVIVLLAQSLCIELPLALSLSSGWPAQREVILSWLEPARFSLAAVLVVFGSMQAWLTLHGETLGRAWRAHWRLLRVNWWDVLWFLVIAAFHLLATNFLRAFVLSLLDANTAPGIVWTLIWPLIAGLVTAWLLSAWVCLFKRCEAVLP